MASHRNLADAAAARAGVAVREVHELDDLAAVRRLFDTVWAADPTNPAITAELLRAFAHTGQYVVVADDLAPAGHPIVAASVAWLTGTGALHSHITGVLPEGRGRGLGLALKAHQRAWAIDRGITEITWTFDPLIRRNAWFNLAKLGARVRGYLVDFYGSMVDGLNAGDESDRLYLSWPVTDPVVHAVLAGGPAAPDAVEAAADAAQVLAVDAGEAPALAWPPPPGAGRALAQVPRDVETLRRVDPGLGRAWRLGLRAVFTEAFDEGWRVAGFAPGGWYVLDRALDQEAVR